LLINDGEDAAGGGVDGDDGTVGVAERFDGGLADDGVVETDDVALRRIAPRRKSARAMRASAASGLRRYRAECDSGGGYRQKAEDRNCMSNGWVDAHVCSLAFVPALKTLNLLIEPRV
jgi:hypothetical protein